MIFDKRAAFKPFEYPELERFKTAINHSYWLVSEWNFLGDVHDFHTRLTPAQREVIKRTLLAISQIEVSVKRFWADVGKQFPKPEIEQVGMTFAESEVRHADAYSQLLKVLGLSEDFEALLTVPAIRNRVAYLGEFLSGNNRDLGYSLTLALFSMFIENVSLFSQFAIIKSFNKHEAVLKDIDNVVQATQKEEQIHALFGIALLNIVKREFPESFDECFYRRLADAASRAYYAECGIIDWIFEQGELEFLTPTTLKAFIAQRLNESLEAVGAKPVFEVPTDALEPLRWFNEEIYAETSTDFFHKRPVTYSKKAQPTTAEDLF